MCTTIKQQFLYMSNEYLSNMAYPKEIDSVIKSIPKEHHKSIKKIIDFYYSQGVKDTQNLIQQMVGIHPKEINNHGVWHARDLSGG